jgi:hypothetical protein
MNKKKVIIGVGVLLALGTVAFFGFKKDGWFRKKEDEEESPSNNLGGGSTTSGGGSTTSGGGSTTSGGSKTSQDLTLNDLAVKAYNAPGGAWYKDDDEDAIYEVLSALKTKKNYEAFKKVFKDKYGKDFWTFISGFLENTELYTCKNIIKKYK